MSGPSATANRQTEESKNSRFDDVGTVSTYRCDRGQQALFLAVKLNAEVPTGGRQTQADRTAVVHMAGASASRPDCLTLSGVWTQTVLGCGKRVCIEFGRDRPDRTQEVGCRFESG